MQGKVLKVGQDKVSGKCVTLQHGNFTVSYCHLSQISVSQGQAVLSDNVIGITGNTGRSTGEHLHITCKYTGNSITPMFIFKHIEEYGGDPSKIYVGGHSAGGYLTLMLVLCPEYMDRFGADAGLIRKAYPVSGQTFTHFTIKKERGMPMDLPFIDEYAPVNNVRQDGAPLMLITGDRELEMLCRYEENECLLAILKHFRHPAELYELDGFDHGNVVVPACILIRNDIHRDCRTGD